MKILLLFLLYFNFINCLAQKVEIPELQGDDIVIDYTGFSLVYDECHEQAKWVAYELTKNETVKLFDRKNNFKPDPQINTFTANNKDYHRSGYDRGHLAPAGDMVWSEKALNESFYYSNISPQHPKMNRGVWKELEALVRNWAIEHESLYIVTGPVLKTGLKQIGENKVSVPDSFYKVVLYKRNDEVKGIGFLIPNREIFRPLEYYVVPIDSVEIVTGINFFPDLNKFEELMVEQGKCKECWNW